MDRREALHRLAAGGAVAVGASAVVSQPAFAFDDPIVTGGPVVLIDTTSARTATILVGSAPPGVCPESAISTPSPTQVSLTWQTFWPDGNTVMSSGSGTSVSIPPGFLRWFVNDRIRVTLVYRYQCVYGASTAEVCVQWFREFAATSNGGGAGWVLLISTGPTTVACPAGLAASRSAGVVYAPGGRIDRPAPDRPTKGS